MEDNFQDVLNSIEPKAGRSRLESYGELVESLSRKGFSCRDIAALLSKKVQLRTSKSAVNNFIRARARKRTNETRQVSRTGSIAPPVPKAVPSPSSREAAPAEVLQRIAALKARKPAKMQEADDFYFDATEPLRLIDPGKQASMARPSTCLPTVEEQGKPTDQGWPQKRIDALWRDSLPLEHWIVNPRDDDKPAK